MYLNDLVRIIRIYKGAIKPTIEHLKIPPVLINRLSLPLLSLLRQICLADPMEK